MSWRHNGLPYLADEDQKEDELQDTGTSPLKTLIWSWIILTLVVILG
jgi:hypothetical protein